MQKELQNVARSRLAEAIDALASLDGATAEEIEETVHTVRKRCKEVRGLARLVRPAPGNEFATFNNLVREAAESLSSIRDAHAVLATFDDLTMRSGEHDEHLAEVRARQAQQALEATESLRCGGDERIEKARKLLTKARKLVRRWQIDDGFAPLAGGLSVTYRRGKRGLRAAERNPNDHNLHEWRKAVKNLWYQARLLEPISPSVLSPLVASLDDLAESLGDDHDLAVLIERLRSDPDRYGGLEAADRAVRLAESQRLDLRRRGFRQGRTLYAERTRAFTERIALYWAITMKHGPELIVGGIAELAAQGVDDTDEQVSVVERERKFLVRSLPNLPAVGTDMRQGYLAIDGSVGVRVRDEVERGQTLTVKSGSGAVRTELEWSIEAPQFEAAWAITEDRRVHKTRYRMDVGARTAEIDVFHGSLDGLVLVEVEFSSMGELEEFEPPEWFGDEVTEDDRYANASLAVHGAPAVDTAP